jgi:hypothetical protein
MMTERGLGNVVDFGGSRQAAWHGQSGKRPEYLRVRTTQAPVQAIERHVQKSGLWKALWIFTIVFKPPARRNQAIRLPKSRRGEEIDLHAPLAGSLAHPGGSAHQ